VPTSNPTVRRSDDEALVKFARAGDEIALHRLLTRYRPMVHARAQSYFLPGADRDDVIQEAWVGLYQAIRDFDNRHGVPFRGFAEICVTRQVTTAIKAAGRCKHGPLNSYVSLATPVGGPDAGAGVLGDLVPAVGVGDPADIVIARERLRALQRHVCDALSELEAQVLSLHMEGRGQQEIADRLQRHAKSVDNTLQRVRRKVEGHLVARGLAEAG
jgi:RNA polymerase sporulation-specific sigma factor